MMWSNEYKKQIKVVAGSFDDFMCAKIFAEAYKKHYSASAEIIEYVMIKKVGILGVMTVMIDETKDECIDIEVERIHILLRGLN